MIRIRFIRIVDAIYKFTIVFTMITLGHYSAAYIKGQYNYTAYVENLQKEVERTQKKQMYINDVKNHVFADDLSNKSMIYKVVAESSRGLTNVFIIATSVSEVDPLKSNLISYKTGFITAYRVNMIIQGGIMDVRSVIKTISANLPNISWQEIIFDSKKFPSKYASVTLYVLSI